MPYFTRADIERIAIRVTTAYKKLPFLQGNTENKIRPDVLVRDLFGVTAEYHNLSRNGTILGLTGGAGVGVKIFDDPERPEYIFLDGKTLLLDKRLREENANVGRHNFTLIHEACHLIFQMLFPQEYMREPRCRQIHYCTVPPARYGDYWEEWRTNALASAVLMPSDMLRSNMATFGLGEKLHLLNKVFAPAEYCRFTEMADYMGVSRQALSIRMKQLGLLDIDQLQDPYAFVNVFPDEEEL